MEKEKEKDKEIEIEEDRKLRKKKTKIVIEPNAKALYVRTQDGAFLQYVFQGVCLIYVDYLARSVSGGDSLTSLDL